MNKELIYPFQIPTLVKSWHDYSQSKETTGRIGFGSNQWDKKFIYKPRPNLIFEKIIEYRQKLQTVGVTVGPEPWEIKDDLGLSVEVAHIVSQEDAAHWLQSVDKTSALSFFKDVMLKNIMLLWTNQEKKAFLDWSLDNLPNNYAFDNKKKSWVFIDYEPVPKDINQERLRNLHHLVHYSLIKFLRERPDLYESAVSIVLEFCTDMGHQSFIKQQIHYTFWTELHVNGKQKAKEYLLTLNNYSNFTTDSMIGLMASILSASNRTLIQKVELAHYLGHTLKKRNLNDFYNQVLRLDF